MDGPSTEANLNMNAAAPAASSFVAPQLSMPKGGGAIRGIGEKFAANPVTGTGSLTIPLAMTPGRSGFGPQHVLSYESGAGNGPFGLGWSLALPAVTRRTDKGLPIYDDPVTADACESDIFILSGTEDLVSVLVEDDQGQWAPEHLPPRDGYTVRTYRPRSEGLFARIERWIRMEDGSSHWRSISRDNVLTVYGFDAASRVADPDNPRRIFSWLICQSYDDKGNAILYDYAAEDDAGIDRDMPSEQRRKRTANRYLKRIRYGNREPLMLDPSRPDFRKSHLEAANADQAHWMFSVVFDYDEGHHREEPADRDGRIFTQATYEPRCAWTARRDPFSTFRPTFEVRTYRLCRRVLMFHHFPAELGMDQCLVRSTTFAYRERPFGSFMERVVQSGHRRWSDDRYLTSSLPPLELAYTKSPLEEVDFDGFAPRDVDAESLTNLPAGVNGGKYRWLDLNGEGISGVLAEQDGTWLYKPNLGEGRLGATEIVRAQPALGQRRDRSSHLMDVAGEGKLDLVDFSAASPGFYPRTLDEGWGGFRAFRSLPVLDWNNSNLRFVDLTGDGIADVLITEDVAFIWHPSLLKDGYGAAIRVLIPLEEEESGPRVIFADSTQSIFLADMTGDGLSDLLRIRNGEVCYWPNRGYGHFGAKVVMDHSPWFDEPDAFDQRRIRLSDVDGSGTTDILYLSGDGVGIYLNESGNSLSAARCIGRFPAIDGGTSVDVADLLGRGTACLIWSSPLPRDAGRQLRYIDLMCGRKPNLLEQIDNHMGAVRHIEFASSTEFYLADELAGTPWVTRLPFPVHVVKRVESHDRVSRSRLVTCYSYHHGFYDGLEREFRGFGRVDELDTEDIASLTASGNLPWGENWDHASSVPPVLTKSWYHTGVFLGGERVSRHLEHEYYRGDSRGDEVLLDDTLLPDHLTSFEAREACRALKGSLLHREVYALDGTPESRTPYSVADGNFSVELVQPQGLNRYAVFFTHPREAITLNYERDADDPRIKHELTLAVDRYGNVLRMAAIGYQRREPEFEEQRQTLATLTENRYTDAVLEADAYRTPLAAEVKIFQLTGPRIRGAMLLRFSDVQHLAAIAQEIPYEREPAAGETQKRLIEQTRSLYRANDLSSLLPDGRVQSLALPGEQYKRALTAGLLEVFRAKASRDEINQILARPDAGYRDIDGSGPYWIPSGRVYYRPDQEGSMPEELSFALRHFFLPHRYRDPFGHSTIVEYDDWQLTPVRTRDAVGNEVRAVLDYRVLQPKQITDFNGNRSEARFDALGMLAGTAVSGKPGEHQGDSFEDFAADLAPAEINTYFDAQDPRRLAVEQLGSATTRIVYDLTRVPVCSCSIARETHLSVLERGEKTRVQLHYVYADGFGREVQTKIQAEPGPLDPNDENSTVANPRWVGTGAKIYNNKGKPVRQYEPFFSATAHFGIEKWGVSSVLFYDPVERVVAALHPNESYEKLVVGAWKQASFDVNDTVTFDPPTDPDIGSFFRRLPEADYLPTWYAQRIDGQLGPHERAAAEKAARHANTPTVVHFDVLGRTFLSLTDNGRDAEGVEQLYPTRTVLDIEGNHRAIVDARERVVMRHDYDLLGTRLRQQSMEAGESWILNDAAGKPLRSWNSRDYAFRMEYDQLHRPLRSFVCGGRQSECGERYFAGDVLFDRTIYGDSPDTDLTDSQRRERNVRGRVYRHHDGAGIVKTENYDFKGNSLTGTRQFAAEFRRALDWSTYVALESEIFASSRTYDALNRAIAVTAPDGSIYRPTFNDASLLMAVDVHIRGEEGEGGRIWTPFVRHINYDAKGQRTVVRYANGATTTHHYDSNTYRLVHLKTIRPAGDSEFTAQIFAHPETVQDLRYTYDPVGNITRIEDVALKTVFHANRRVDPAANYAYDPLYRLLSATGREQAGQSAFSFAPRGGNYRDFPVVGSANLHDPKALRNYLEQFEYDPVGNFRAMRHHAEGADWHRLYEYGEPSLTEPWARSNRLSCTSTHNGSTTIIERYRHDAHGNIVEMPHLPWMRWDFQEQLHATSRQVVNEGTPETTWYVYDATGQRARKTTTRHDGQRKSERVYLGGFEVYREFELDGAVARESQTLHVMDDKQRIALIETRIVDRGTRSGKPAPRQRYQLTNHLGSATVELDHEARLISYEEYSPYGVSTLQVGRSVEVREKRYRYTGKERDEENGFTYHGARYCAPWLGRWTACDPSGLVDGSDLYVYGRNNPVNLVDNNGADASDPDAKAPWYAKALIWSVELVFGGNSASAPTSEDEARNAPRYKPPDEAAEKAAANVVIDVVETIVGGSAANGPKNKEQADNGLKRESYAVQAIRVAALVAPVPKGLKAFASEAKAAAVEVRAGAAEARTASKAAAGGKAAADEAKSAGAARSRQSAGNVPAAQPKTGTAPGVSSAAAAVSSRLAAAQALVAEAGKASGISNIGRYVDQVTYGGTTSFFEVQGGKRVLNIGSNAFARTRAGQLSEAAHELVHAQQFQLAVNRAGGNIPKAWVEFSSHGAGSAQYAADEVTAETLAINRVSKYLGGVSPQQAAASSRYVKDWRAAQPPPKLP